MLKRVLKKVISFALILITLSGGVIASALTVSAVSIESGDKQYSNVLDDLKRDSTFDTSKYSDNENDNSVKLIQIAESTDNHLFLYVYQPCDAKIDLKCTKVSIHVGYSINGSDLDPEIFDLKLVSTEGVFDKYLVEGFESPDEPFRYYNVVALYREYNHAVDGDSISGSDTNEKSFSVGQQWCVYTLNGHLVYEMNTFETIQLDCKFSGNVELGTGVTLGGLLGSFEFNDLWFYAFDSDDYIIEKVFEAKMTYKQRDMWWSTGSDPNYNDWSDPLYSELDYREIIEHEAPGLYGKKYSFNQIISTDEFIKQCVDQEINLPEDVLDELDKSRFVFCFALTEKKVLGGGYTTQIFKKDIGYTGVLQIKFQDITGNIYDLGAVTDLIDPDDIADGFGSGFDTDAFKDFFETIIFILFLILIAVFLAPILTVIKFFVSSVMFILKLLCSIISIPFKIIKGMFSKK